MRALRLSSRLLPLLLCCQLVMATAKGRGKKLAKGEHSSLDLYGHVTRDVQTRALSSQSAYEARQGLKVLLGSKNGTLSPMMVRRDASVERAVFADFSRRLTNKDALVGVGPGKSILCVGARLGGEVRAFTRLGALAVGVDFMPGFRNAWSLWGDATHIQFANGVYDYVYCNIIDHIDPRHKFLAEVARVLKRGGMLVAYVDQNKPDAFSVHDNRGETLVKMRAEMASAGLIIAREEKHGGGKTERPLPQNWGGTVVFVARKA